MHTKNPHYAPLGLVNLTDDPDTIEVLGYLLPLKSDAVISWYVAEINRQAKMFIGWSFQLRFDQTIASKNIRRRIFVRRDFISA